MVSRRFRPPIRRRTPPGSARWARARRRLPDPAAAAAFAHDSRASAAALTGPIAGGMPAGSERRPGTTMKTASRRTPSAARPARHAATTTPPPLPLTRSTEWPSCRTTRR
jgi:hypothetical protein